MYVHRDMFIYSESCDVEKEKKRREKKKEKKERGKKLKP